MNLTGVTAVLFIIGPSTVSAGEKPAVTPKHDAAGSPPSRFRRTARLRAP